VNAKEAADKIGTDAKTLRRFIRSGKSTFKAVGSGDRYDFDEKDIPTLRKRFEEWRSGATKSNKRQASSTVKVKKFIDQDEPMPVSMLSHRMTRSQREARDAASRARVDRLEAQLRASGKHISQYSNWGEKVDA
jgi:hypothetical protein